MKISAVRADVARHAAPLLVIPVLQGDTQDAAFTALDHAMSGHLAALLARGDVRGAFGETVVVFPPAGTAAAERVLMVGVGRGADLTPERLRRAAGSAAEQAAKSRASSVAFAVPASAVASREAARALAEGLVLGAYDFREWKTEDPAAPARAALSEAVLLLPEGADAAEYAEGARIGEIIARGENLARTLGNLPGNVATPTYLAQTAERIAAEQGMTVTILGPEEMRAERMDALLAVAAGSAQEPRLIVLEHRGGAEGEKPLVIVGKGLTFDAGGISIKPAQGMEEMKFDMCGGAGTLGAMQAIAELNLPVNVVGIVPSSENLLGSKAMKPGDIIRGRGGKTIEVVNTDAEGRLILVDAISYAEKYEPAAMLDAATLTGACVIALGHAATAVLGNDQALLDEVIAAGEHTGERCWPLPMFDDYREQIKSDYADLKNSGGRPAGTITAAWFLREFVGDWPWVHLDVAGTAYGEGKLSYLSKGSTGVPTRIFVQWVMGRAARRETPSPA
ncbi:leucyl aminopeptidase [Longimicrobium terrae]|uniref:Probable cytosol aminopeptidase n=1 Tax=Longimicrobium terrae TaxID=1639882 RepID=A0A841H4N4_9BACT|nr:leucyl aminopeptidase [Longimicrobium terrae]MBB4638741.1 leucyl aminopeptidase [Longimicrobium terrae]MBB6072980.1 leucyl aminopeptidase [Longimicrobium terrae]NNC33105.1 leucyl aminopeptidase [Longimicrobium terrae]